MSKGLFVLNRFFMVVSLFILGSCAFNSAPTLHQEQNEVYLSDGRIIYLGEITHEKNEQVFSLFKSNDNVTLLEISSVGGDVLDGMELGSWIKDRNLDVQVGMVCASSCANYVFLAGNNKYLQEKSILVWHGSSYQPDIDILVKSGHEFTNRWREQEKAFFKRVGVNYQITTCGITQVPTGLSILHFLNITNIKGFDYSIEDMERFGVKGITFVDSNWLGSPNLDLQGVFRASYCE